MIVNPGSVGQPRDRISLASYSILEMKDENTPECVHFHRIEYPIQPVVDKIHAIDALSNWLGDRLLEGC